MSDHESKPTPPSGMPAVVAATHEAKTTEALSDATGQRVLNAIAEMRTEARERDVKIDARFERLESSIEEVRAETKGNSKNIGEQADALTRVASAAAKAADLALEAKKQAANASDETTKVVESALRIHGASIAMSVDQAVKASLAPLAADVEAVKKDGAEKTTALQALKKSDEETEKTLKDHGAKIDGVVTSIGTIAKGVARLLRWQDALWFKIAIVAAVLVGGFVAGMRAAQKEAPTQTTTIISPAAPTATALPPAPSSSH